MMKPLQFKSEFGIGEVLTASAAASLAMAAIYNYGFFWRPNWNYVFLLSLQDIGISILGALPVVLLLIPMILSLLRREYVSKEAKISSGIIAALAIAAWIISIFYYDLSSKDISQLVFFLLAVAASIVAICTISGWPAIPSSILGILCLSIFSYALGDYSYRSNSDFENDRIFFNDGTTVDCSIFRISSKYIFFKSDGLVSVVKIDAIASISEIGSDF